MLFTIVYLGLEPQIAQTSDAGIARIERIIQLIKFSKYSIHDLSRMVANEPGELARFNMPFELGLDIGIRNASTRSKFASKKTMIIDVDQFRYKKALSDISGNDIAFYDKNAEKLVLAIRNWVTTTIHPKQPSGSLIWEEYNEFMNYFNEFTIEEGYTSEDLDSLPNTELIYWMKKWIQSRQKI